MPDTPWPIPRPLVIVLLVVAATSVAIPLAFEALGVDAPFERTVVAPAVAWMWGVAALAGLLSAVVLLALRRPPRSSVLGAVTVTAVVAIAGLAWQAAAGSEARFAPCRVPPQAGAMHLVSAQTSVDGILRADLEVDDAPIDADLAGLFGDLPLGAAEDLGVEDVHLDGASVAARHCRALVSGSQVTAALPALYDGSMGAALVPGELPIWRGDFDWWLASDGSLRLAAFRVGGHPADAWPVDGLRGQLLVELRAERIIGE
jgi:hypothetical protein